MTQINEAEETSNGTNNLQLMDGIFFFLLTFVYADSVAANLYNKPLKMIIVFKNSFK